MRSVGLYSATDQELPAVARARERLTEIECVVRAGSDIESADAARSFADRLVETDVVLFWLHGSDHRLPAYDAVREQLDAADVPLFVTSSGTTEAVTDTTGDPAVRERLETYFEAGGAINIANALRCAIDAATAADIAYDDPVDLPQTGVYHPEHPGTDYAGLTATFDEDRPTVGIWFYESHWTNENTAYIDALVQAIEAAGANALPVFTTPVADEQRDAEWVATHWFSDDGRPIVDAVCSSFMFSLSMDERGRDASDEGERATEVFLDQLGVPVLQAITTMQSRAAYAESDIGLDGFEIALSVALPEFDGAVITHPISGKERARTDTDGTAPTYHRPIDDRITHVAHLAVNWARLRRQPTAETDIAVVLHNYPPSDDGIGTAFGLDTPASLHALLKQLDAAGYTVEDLPADGQHLIETIVKQLTADGRWVDPAEIRATSVDVIEPGTYREWFQALNDDLAEEIVTEWGAPPEHAIAIPGVRFGNVLVSIQPPRGFEADPETIYHDSALYPPHEYVAFYAWLRRRFDADAVVHLGTHGSLEWLPGKTVGLDAASAGDQLIGALPNVYPYIVNNPGEGAQAKRRSYAAIVDHLTPPMRAAGTYDELAELESLVAEYRRLTREDGPRDRQSQLAGAIREAVTDADLGADIGIEDVHAVKADTLAAELHEYLTDLKTTQIRMGLHTLGEPPSGDALVEYLVALTRFENADGPSLRRAVAAALGVPVEAMETSPEAYDETLGMFYAEAADRVYETSVRLVERLAEAEFAVDPSTCASIAATVEPLGETTPAPAATERLKQALVYICETVVPRVRGATAELPRVADALAGEYVPPGGSGAPTRGGVDLLPTGRNFYTLDPRKIPDTAAWAVGRRVAETMLDRHRAEHGRVPEEVGVVAWGTPTVRTNGETIAQALALLGVKPVWTASGRVEGVDPIPLAELGRPRVDVTLRVSGLFRDAFPGAAGIVQEAIETVADLSEPPEQNFVRKHVTNEHSEGPIRRVFTTRPGGYGSGTNKAITTGHWEDDSDLADVFVQWGGYAMDDNGEVTDAHDAFERRLTTIEATIKLEDTDEQDEFDSSDWYAFHGGFQRAVADRRGEAPAAYVGDASDPDRPQVYTNEQKLRKTMRTRVLNPDWIESMEAHDYKGAGDLATTVDIALGWDATTDAVSDRLWEDIAEQYALDEDRQDWFRDVNPWALESIADTLLEAIDRDLWSADQSMADRLRDVALSVEGDLEAKTASREGRGDE